MCPPPLPSASRPLTPHRSPLTPARLVKSTLLTSKGKGDMDAGTAAGLDRQPTAMVNMLPDWSTKKVGGVDGVGASCRAAR
jgi:hypothetical protein